MQGRALILWRSPDRRVGGSIKAEASGVTLADTLDELKAAALKAIDKAPDHQAFGWYYAEFIIKRESETGKPKS